MRTAPATSKIGVTARPRATAATPGTKRARTAMPPFMNVGSGSSGSTSGPRSSRSVSFMIETRLWSVLIRSS